MRVVRGEQRRSDSEKGLPDGVQRRQQCDAAECTAMKATWLSKVDVAKRVGSLLWLKNRMDADYMLRTGTMVFGAIGACCSSFAVKDNGGPCYYYNRYEHK